MLPQYYLTFFFLDDICVVTCNRTNLSVMQYVPLPQFDFNCMPLACQERSFWTELAVPPNPVPSDGPMTS
jgi:hypothetical protein